MTSRRPRKSPPARAIAILEPLVVRDQCPWIDVEEHWSGTTSGTQNGYQCHPPVITPVVAASLMACLRVTSSILTSAELDRYAKPRAGFDA